MQSISVWTTLSCAVGVALSLLPTLYASEPSGIVYMPNSKDNPASFLVSLEGLDGSGYLRGDAADVSNAIMARAFSNTLQFEYDPALPGEQRIHFGETMAYYHITAVNRSLNAVESFVDPGVVPVVAFNGVHVGDFCMPLSTQYDPMTRTIYLAADFGCNQSDALDGDVIVHEYMHAVQHFLLELPANAFVSTQTTMSEQARALTEGLADFGTASRFHDAEVGEWSAIIFHGREYLRSVENFRCWPVDLREGDPHRTGMVFSGAMWDLQSVVGGAVAQALWLRMMSSIADNDPGTPEMNTTFADALTGLLEADQTLYDGGHEQQIRQAFAVHGIGEYDFTTPYPMVRNPGNGYDGILVHIEPGAASLLVRFDEFVSKLDDSRYTTNELPQPGVDEKSTWDELLVLDGSDTVIDAFTGRQLQGATVRVQGDTVKFHLVTDSFLPPFGYRVVDIRPIVAADFDGDADVDGDDLTLFAACTTGPAVGPPAAGCEDADLDADQDVDQNDFGLLQRCFSGSNTAPDAGCMN